MRKDKCTLNEKGDVTKIRKGLLVVPLSRKAEQLLKYEAVMGASITAMIALRTRKRRTTTPNKGTKRRRNVRSPNSVSKI
jgi:hypothetical protein